MTGNAACSTIRSQQFDVDFDFDFDFDFDRQSNFMSNQTYNVLWRDTMRDLLEIIELDPGDYTSDDEVMNHYAYLYIRYLLAFRNLEEVYDQHVHPQKRLDIRTVPPPPPIQPPPSGPRLRRVPHA
jgi:hypothetical protein